MMRNYFLDYYKIVLAIFVVGIHTSPLTEYSKPLSFIFNLGIFRLAVPTFFLINGYYAVAALSTKESLKRYLSRIGTLYLLWMALYFPIYVFTHDFSAKNVVWGFITLLYGYGHLWYITALMGGMVLLYYLINRYSKKTVLFLAFFFYFIGSLVEIGQGYLSLGNQNIKTEILQLQMWKLNFIFFGFPFIAIGYYMKREMHQFKPRYFMLIALLLFSIELIISYKFLTHGRNMLFSLIFLTPLILSYLLSLKWDVKDNKSRSNLLQKLPNSIYYIHGLPNFFIAVLYTNINSSYKFIAVSVISIIVGILLIKLNDKVPGHFKNKMI